MSARNALSSAAGAATYVMVSPSLVGHAPTARRSPDYISPRSSGTPFQ